MGFDDVIPHLGGFGRYQKGILLLLCLPIVNSFLYVLNANHNLYNEANYNSGKILYVLKMQIVGCVSGFLIFGLLSDVLGRKPALLTAFLLQLIFGFLKVTNIAEHIGYIISEIVIHASIMGVFIIVFVMGIEILSPEKRAYSGVILMTNFWLSYIPAWLNRNLLSNWMSWFFVLCSLLCISYYWIVPESVRWLQAKGCKQKAVEITQKTARANRSKIPTQTLLEFFDLEQAPQLGQQEEASSYSWYQLPCSNLICRTLIIAILFYANYVCHGLFHTNNFTRFHTGTDNKLVFYALQISGMAGMMFMFTRWARRPIICGAMLLAGTCALLLRLSVETTLLTTFIDAIGFVAVTISFLGLHIFTAEQFPTLIRTVSLGVFSSVALMDTIIDLIEFSSYNYRKYYGLLMIIGALLSLLLPETLNKPLPDTFKDAKNIGRKARTTQDVEHN